MTENVQTTNFIASSEELWNFGLSKVFEDVGEAAEGAEALYDRIGALDENGAVGHLDVVLIAFGAYVGHLDGGFYGGKQRGNKEKEDEEYEELLGSHGASGKDGVKAPARLVL